MEFPIWYIDLFLSPPSVSLFIVGFFLLFFHSSLYFRLQVRIYRDKDCSSQSLLVFTFVSTYIHLYGFQVKTDVSSFGQRNLSK